MKAARELVRQAHACLYRACSGHSMMSDHLVWWAQTLLEKAAVLLPDGLSENATNLAVECAETMRGALGYTITLEQRADELLDAATAAVAIEHERKAA